MSTCLTNDDCGRFQVCSNFFYCHHQSLYENDPAQIIALIGFVVIQIFSFATGLGVVPVLVLSLQLWLNFNKHENVGLLQLVQMTMCFLIILQYARKQHPHRKTIIIDLRLSSIILPTLISGLFFGLYMRNYVPLFILSLFTASQLLLMCGIQIFKLRESEKIQKIQKSVQLKIVESDSSSDDNLTDDVIIINLDSVQIDFQKLFERIKNSKHKHLYLQQLPPQFQDLEIMDPQTNTLVKVSDYLSYQQGQIKFLINKIDDNSSLKVQTTEEQNLIENGGKQDQKVNLKFNFVNEFDHPRPIFEIIFVFVVVFYNVIILYLLSGRKNGRFAHIEGDKTCFTDQIWLLMLLQFLGNSLLTILGIGLLKYKENRLIQTFKLMLENKLTQMNAQRELREHILATHTDVHFLGFNINFWNSLQILITGVVGGFVTGFVGIGSIIILLAMLKNLKLHMTSLMTSIALMVFCVTFLGVLLQELMGIISWGNCLLLFLLTIVGIVLSGPVKNILEKRQNWMHRIVWSSLIFYAVITVLYLILWIVDLVRHTEEETNTSSRNSCGNKG